MKKLWQRFLNWIGLFKETPMAGDEFDYDKVDFEKDRKKIEGES